jgi:hypothetical protein
VRWLKGPILICAGILLTTFPLWAKGLNLNDQPIRFFASPSSYLSSNLEEIQVPRSQLLFPKFQERKRADSVVSVVTVLSSVDPWGDESGQLSIASVADPGALESEWEAPRKESYDWGGAISQALLFTTVGHVFRVASEEKTRRELDGPFFEDWFKSAGSLFSSGWSDGGRDFTNYVVHPLSGAVYGHIYRQNHPQDRDVRISLSKGYFGHMAKTTAFSFVASLAWEIGPYSEASIGNVGLYNTAESQQMTWGDIVVTPVLGVWGVMVIEDLLERFVIRKVEGKTANRWIKALVRIPLTPTRSAANLMAIKRPDYRPDRQ